MQEEQKRISVSDKLIDNLVKCPIDIARTVISIGNHVQVSDIQLEESKGYRGLMQGLDLEEGEYCYELLEMKENKVIKGNKTKSQMKEIIDNTISTFYTLFDHYYYDEHPSNECESVYFTTSEYFNEIFPLCTEAYANNKNYINFYLDEFVQLTSKYDVFLYLKIKQFKSTGKIIIMFDKVKELFNDDVRNITRRLRKAADKIEKITGKKINFGEIEKKNRINIKMEITFQAEKKEMKEYKETPPEETPLEKEYDPYIDDAEYIFEIYPKKKNKIKTIKIIKQLLKIHSRKELVYCTLAYRCSTNGVDSIYIKDPDNFFKNKYTEYLELSEEYKYYLNLVEKQMNNTDDIFFLNQEG